MIGIALLIVVLILMLIFALSSFLHSKNTNTLSKKELRETIETLKAEHAQVAKPTE